jgi:hypothetical protein
VLVELLRDAVVITTLSRPLHEALLSIERAMPPVENPSDANMVDVADSCTAKLLALPAGRQFIVGKRRLHASIVKRVVWASVHE